MARERSSSNRQDLIPYFSGLRTDDEVGLVFGRITDFYEAGCCRVVV
jgi:hypothetical protein